MLRNRRANKSAAGPGDSGRREATRERHARSRRSTRPVGGRLLTRPFRWLLIVAGVGVAVAIWRFLFGIGAVTNLTDGYPWGVWIAFDVVVGTALGCGGYAVALLVYILNKGEYHPLVRPAVLTSLLGYGLAVIAVTIDLGRFWGLWKVPIFVWRWTHSPQLEVALCVMAYIMVLARRALAGARREVETSPQPRARGVRDEGAALVNKSGVWILALGILLPTMHQSSLGTMMLLAGPRLHPLWFTALAAVPVPRQLPDPGLRDRGLRGASFAARRSTGRARPRCSAGSPTWRSGSRSSWSSSASPRSPGAGELGLVASPLGAIFLAEIALHLVAVAVLDVAARARRSGLAGAGGDPADPRRRGLPRSTPIWSPSTRASTTATSRRCRSC